MHAHLLFAFALLMSALLPGAAGAQAPGAAAQTGETAAVSNPRVKLVTSLGDIELELDAQRAPNTVANFLAYVDDGHYNGSIFHRVIPDMLVQGGGFTPDLQHKPTRAPIASESGNGLKNLRGSVAAARLPGDAHSATAQFFINTVDNPDLDFSSEQSDYTRGYTVFGRVVHGLDVVDRIRAVETTRQPPFETGVPKTAVVIERIERLPQAARQP